MPNEEDWYVGLHNNTGADVVRMSSKPTPQPVEVPLAHNTFAHVDTRPPPPHQDNNVTLDLLMDSPRETHSLLCGMGITTFNIVHNGATIASKVRLPDTWDELKPLVILLLSDKLTIGQRDTLARLRVECELLGELYTGNGRNARGMFAALLGDIERNMRNNAEKAFLATAKPGKSAGKPADKDDLGCGW